MFPPIKHTAGLGQLGSILHFAVSAVLITMPYLGCESDSGTHPREMNETRGTDPDCVLRVLRR